MDLISRQAAIEALEEPCKVTDTWTDEYAVGERMQWEKDVKALNSLPPAQPYVPDTNVGDMISRQAAIDALKVAYWDNDIQSAKADLCIVDAMTDWAIRQVKALPSAERHGRWTREVLGSTSGYGTTIMYQCSECETMAISKYHYCPNCGSSMIKEVLT